MFLHKLGTSAPKLWWGLSAYFEGYRYRTKIPEAASNMLMHHAGDQSTTTRDIIEAVKWVECKVPNFDWEESTTRKVYSVFSNKNSSLAPCELKNRQKNWKFLWSRMWTAAIPLKERLFCLNLAHGACAFSSCLGGAAQILCPICKERGTLDSPKHLFMECGKLSVVREQMKNLVSQVNQHFSFTWEKVMWQGGEAIGLLGQIELYQLLLAMYKNSLWIIRCSAYHGGAAACAPIEAVVLRLIKKKTEAAIENDVRKSGAAARSKWESCAPALQLHGPSASLFVIDL